MKYTIALLALILSSALQSFSQTATPTPKPADDADVVKISTTLIQIDVTVKDKDGKIVRDLKPEEFEIYENGKKREITNFSFVSVENATKQTVVKSGDKEKILIPLPPVPVKPEQVRRTIALVVDDLGLSFESVYYVRRALKKFVDEQMQPNDLVAVIRTGSGIGALQQFTTDKRQLYAAIENIKWNAQGRAGISAFAPLEATPLEQQQAAGGNVSADDLADEQKAIKDFDSFREDIFSVGTLGAINFVVKGLSELPGRKSIMLFSDGFAICPPDNPDRCARILNSVKKLTDLSNRASVAIYTFDARGLQTTGLTAADNTGGVSAERIQQIDSTRSGQLFETREGLSYLAAQTGGRAYFNSNDINKGLDKALADQQGYYLIGYQPDAETFDPKTQRYNKLQVKVLRKDTDVRYRSGFFGISDEQIKKPAAAQTVAQQLSNALGSPFGVSDIGLHLNTLYGNNAKQGDFVSSFLHVNAKDLKFTDEPDGTKKAVFDVLAVSFGANGAPGEQIAQTYTFKVPADAYRQLLEKGFVYYFTFPVKKPGAYQYRVAIRDAQTQKIGSANQFIEVPNLKKNRLTLSGLALENLTEAQWRKLYALSTGTPNQNVDKSEITGDSLNATALRRFKRGTVLRFGYEIYDAKIVAGQKPSLTTQTRIFHDGKIIFEGKQLPLPLFDQTDFERIKAIGAINLGSEMPAGEYVLQIVATDALAREKSKIATQFVQFEVVE